MSTGHLGHPGGANTEASPGATLQTASMSTPALEAVHLRKYFPVRQLRIGGTSSVVHAVEDASLALHPGRALALVGESGSGKTTVARLLARLYALTAGSI